MTKDHYTALTLTFVAAIDLRLADKSRGIHSIAAQKHIVWIRVATTDVARHVVISSAIMSIKVIVTSAITTTSENSAKLERVIVG